MKKLSIYFLILLWTSILNAGPLSEEAMYWDGLIFKQWNGKKVKNKKQIVKERTVFFSCKHLSTYGHALLDGVLAFYAVLKRDQLLDTPLNICIAASNADRASSAFKNILQLMKDVFKFKRVILLDDEWCNVSKENQTYFKKLIINEYVPFYGHPTQRTFFEFYRACPESYGYLSVLRTFGFQDNVVFQDTQTGDNIVKDFARFVIKAYNINLQVIKNRICIPARHYSRKIRNLNELAGVLWKNGYSVVIQDFEKIPVREQIIHVMQSEYVLGTYGSSMANSIFQKPESSVVVLWPKYAKYFWSRRYCILHSAFLAAGVKLIEYDKPDYDTRDSYPEQIREASYFYREDSINKLRPEKINMDAIVKYPLDGMFEMLNVDIYVDPEEIVYRLKHS